jgi:hypothetical protein
VSESSHAAGLEPRGLPILEQGWALLTGLGLAAVTSGGILEARLTGGNMRVGMVANAAVTLAAIFALAAVHRFSAPASRVVLAQLVGASMGIVGIHLALRLGWVDGPAWLSERPAQLVNDAAAVSATLLIVWACARRLDVTLLAVALVLLSAYRLTARAWHLDAPPHGFVVSVQDLVVAEALAAALALALYRWARA